MHAYDTKDLERLFGLPASAVRALARAGNIQPVRRARQAALLVSRSRGAAHRERVARRRKSRRSESTRPCRSCAPPCPQAPRSIRSRSPRSAIGSPSAKGRRCANPNPANTRWPWISSRRKAACTSLRGRMRAGGPRVVRARRDAAAIPPRSTTPTGLCTRGRQSAGGQRAYELCLKADPDHWKRASTWARLLHLAGRLAEAERVYRVGAQGGSLHRFQSGGGARGLGARARGHS